MAAAAPVRMESPLETREILRRADRGYTAAVQRPGGGWIGWIDDVAGVNSQGDTREELMENLASALEEALEMQ